MRRIFQLLCGLALLTVVSDLCVQISYAQHAQITGRVTDSSDAVVPGVEITVTNIQMNVQKTTLTNDAGIYVVPFLVPAMYTMKVELAGFKSITRSAIKLEIDQVARIDFSLEVGAVSESVTVTEGAPLLQSESSGVGQVVGQKKVVDLPASERPTTPCSRELAASPKPARGFPAFPDSPLPVMAGSIP